jgi:LPS sulfotransferase NodH
MASIFDPKLIRQKLAIRTNLITLGKEWMAYLAFYLKPYPPEQTRIVLFAQGRTGSTLLENLICSTNNFQANGELISQHNSPFKRRFLFPYQYVCGLAKLSKNNFIFHVKLYHLTEEQKIDPSFFLQKLAQSGWKVIYLHRDNRVMHVISNLLADKRRGYHKLNDREEDLRIEVNPGNLVGWIHRRDRYFQKEQECLQSLEHIEIAYEKDLMDSASHQETANRIFDFLGMGHRTVSTKLRKINTKPLRDVVINYSEFEQCILDHGWERFLEQESVSSPHKP